MAGTSVVFDILARDRASDKFDHLSKSVDHSGGALGKFSSMAAHAAKVGAVALAGGAVLAAKGLYEAAQGAVEDQAAAAKLAKTLQTVAHATDGQIASTEDWITAQGKAFGVADDDLRPSLQRLAEATHDVGKAQDLASLAMDVAAAKGKPLVTVSEALMKAYNGSIGGLSRLGVKTKDAAGETISFEAAVKQMADTFGGAASAHADTLAGKMDILKLNISEAGESIGYKLLPYASQAATWLGEHLPAALDAVDKKAGPVFESIVDGAGELKDAVTPLVSELAEAFGHLTKAGGGAGDMWHDTLLPAIQTTSDALATVVDFIDDLPRPVKEFGAQAAVAAIALGQLNKAMAAIKASDFIGNMQDSEKRTAALGTAAKQAAGVGGIALLMSAMQDSGEEAQGLGHIFKTVAGGAGIGAMFGPIGALVGALGGVGLAAAFSKTKDEAHQARIELMKSEGFKDSKSDADDLTEALHGVIHAYGATARAQVKSGLYDENGLRPEVQALRDIGVSMDTIVSATMGQADAQKVVRDHLRESVGDAQSLYEKRKADYEVIKAQVDEARRLGTQATGGRGAASVHIDPELEQRLRDAESAMDDAKNSMDELGVAQETYRQRVKDTTGAIDSAIAVQHKLARQLHLSNDEYKDLPKKFRIEVEDGGLDQTGADLLRTIGRYKDLQNFKKIETLVSAPGATLSADQIKKLQDRYKLTPPQVKTLVNLESGGATSDLNRYQQLLRNLDSPANDVNNYIYTHHVSTGGGSGGGADVYEDSGGPPKHPRTMPQGPTRTVLPPTITHGAQRSMAAPRSATVKHIHEHRWPDRVTLHALGRDFEFALRQHMRDEIEQAEAFAESQRD
jgi:hypothetical protein